MARSDSLGGLTRVSKMVQGDFCIIIDVLGEGRVVSA